MKMSNIASPWRCDEWRLSPKPGREARPKDKDDSRECGRSRASSSSGRISSRAPNGATAAGPAGRVFDALHTAALAERALEAA